MKTAMKWKQDGYLHFAHTSLGMWTIEQRRGRFYVTLTLDGLKGESAEQEMGSYPSLAKAKSSAAKDNRELSKLD